MTPPTSIDGTDISDATIDGQEVQEITVDGQSVFKAVSPFDIEAATLEKSISPPPRAQAGIGIMFKPDGTRMLTMDAGEDEVYQYELSTPHDIGTATLTAELSTDDIHKNLNDPANLVFAKNGTYLVTVSQSDIVLKSLLFPNKFDATGTSSQGQFDFGDVARGVDFAEPEGPIFVLDRSFGTQSTITQFSGDIDAMNSFEIDKVHNIRHTPANGFCIVDGGTRLYTLELRFRTPNRIHQHRLPTPNDIGNVIFEKVITIPQERATGIAFKPDGTKMYILGREPNVIEQFAIE